MVRVSRKSWLLIGILSLVLSRPALSSCAEEYRALTSRQQEIDLVVKMINRSSRPAKKRKFQFGLRSFLLANSFIGLGLGAALNELLEAYYESLIDEPIDEANLDEVALLLAFKSARNYQVLGWKRKLSESHSELIGAITDYAKGRPELGIDLANIEASADWDRDVVDALGRVYADLARQRASHYPAHTVTVRDGDSMFARHFHEYRSRGRTRGARILREIISKDPANGAELVRQHILNSAPIGHYTQTLMARLPANDPRRFEDFIGWRYQGYEENPFLYGVIRPSSPAGREAVELYLEFLQSEKDNQ